MIGEALRWGRAARGIGAVDGRHAEAPITARALVDEVPVDRDDAMPGAESVQRFFAGRWLQRFDGEEMVSHRSLNQRLIRSVNVGGVPPLPASRAVGAGSAGPDRKVAGSASDFSETRPAGSAGPL